MKKIIILFSAIAILLLFKNNTYAQSDDFVTIWDLSKTGSGATQISFKVFTMGTVSYTWESVPSGSSGLGTFTGSTATINALPAGVMIRLRIAPSNFTKMMINYGADKDRLLDIEQWGTVAWAMNMGMAFSGCSNLNITATDLPNLLGVTDIGSLFKDCKKLNGPSNIGNWNTANVTYMSSTFMGAEVFNQPIGNWNTSNVTSMNSMFAGAYAFDQPIGGWNTANVTDMGSLFVSIDFNQPIGDWNTAKVTNMEFMFASNFIFNQPIGNWNTMNVTNMNNMFYNAYLFNQNIENWNTLKVTNMSFMFSGAYAFNQSIGIWNTSNVTNMRFMFFYSTSFNKPIGNWNTANVTNMGSMFSGATLFNQPIGNWNTANVTDMNSMFLLANNFNQSIGNWQLNNAVDLDNMLRSCGLACDNYSSTLLGWANNSNTPQNRSLGASGRHYEITVEPARNVLIALGWTISGDVQISSCNPVAGLEENIQNEALLIFPNPMKNSFQIKGLQGVYWIQLFNTSGLEVLNTIFQSGENADISALEPGLYLLKIKQGAKMYTRKIYKEI